MPRNLVRPTSKGQVTIPKAIRQKLNVNSDTFLSVDVRDGKIVLEPLNIRESSQGLRMYSDADIAQFLKDDVMDPKTAAFMNKLLGTDKY